jgi:hypothetical protein
MLKPADWVYRKNNTGLPLPSLFRDPSSTTSCRRSMGGECHGTRRDRLRLEHAGTSTLFSLLRMFPTTWEGPECMADSTAASQASPLRTVRRLVSKKALQRPP